LYALKLREIFKNILSDDGSMLRCYKDAIGFFEDRNFRPCALVLMRNINENINTLKDAISAYNNFQKLSAFDYYETSANKVLNFYKQIDLPLEQWDGKSLNCLDMQKDDPVYKVTDLDCVRLFLLTSTIKELSSLIQALNWLLKKELNNSEIKKILDNYRDKEALIKN